VLQFLGQIVSCKSVFEFVCFFREGRYLRYRRAVPLGRNFGRPGRNGNRARIIAKTGEKEGSLGPRRTIGRRDGIVFCDRSRSWGGWRITQRSEITRGRGGAKKRGRRGGQGPVFEKPKKAARVTLANQPCLAGEAAHTVNLALEVSKSTTNHKESLFSGGAASRDSWNMQSAEGACSTKIKIVPKDCRGWVLFFRKFREGPRRPIAKGKSLAAKKFHREVSIFQLIFNF